MLDIIGGVAILFLVGSIIIGGLMIGVSIVAPLFVKNTVPVEEGRYIKVNERDYDYDTD
jgi:Na+-transporting methylmalonyl-CoA/oxaloacetate decarboxylase gamma subunit